MHLGGWCGMRRALVIAADHLQAVRERAAHLLFIVRARRYAWIAALAAAICVAGGGAVLYGGLSAGRAAPGAQTARRGGDAWRYLVVCDRCQHRERTLEHPTRTLPQQDGLLRCPACGQFAANWYRRGSQALPPGGW
jgi:hypothetical protein